MYWLCPVFLLIKDTDVENFISFEGTNNLNHLSDVIVCDATQLISIIRRSPLRDYFSQLLCLAMTSDC